MKIDFEFTTAYGKFADALWFADDQPLPSEEEINAMKQQRVDNWIATITAPQEIIEETPIEEV
jgi:hypothetical protein